MAFKHGTYAVTGESLGAAAVTASTCLVAIGATKTGSLGDMAIIHSIEEFEDVFGWKENDCSDYTLQSAVDAAFNVSNLSEIVCISCGQSLGVDNANAIAAAAKVGDVYTHLHRRPNIIIAPVASQDADVAAALVTAATDVLGADSYDAQVFAEVDPTKVTAATIKTAAEDFAASPRLSLFAWEGYRDDAKDVFVSAATIAACEQVAVDAKHNGIPFEVASNRAFNFVPKSQNFVFGRADGNALNEEGINTVIYMDGLKLWGTFLSPYSFSGTTDPAEVHLSVQRMINYRRDLFLRNYANLIDKPFTRQTRDTILVREQAELDRLVAIGALVGEPKIEFRAVDNPTSEVVQGRFVWTMQISPAVPFVSATLNVSFTDSGYAALTEEG